MVTDHTGVNKQAGDSPTKLKVTPADNPTSQSLKAGGDKNVANLKTLKGAAFDKAYVDNEVAYHQAVLDARRQDADPRRQQRRAEGAAGQGAAGVRRAPRACQDRSSRRSASRRRALASWPPRSARSPAAGPGAAVETPEPATHTVVMEAMQL